MYKKKTLKSKRSDFNSTLKYESSVMDIKMDISADISEGVVGEEVEGSQSDYIACDKNFISSPV